jgi:hypothetical protein
MASGGGGGGGAKGKILRIALQFLKKARKRAAQGARTASTQARRTTVTRRTASFGSSTTKNYRETFFNAHPSLRGQVVVHHAVERQAIRRYPGIVSQSEMHSLENLRGIPNGINGRVHLSQIRREWNQFYAANPTATQRQLLDFATKIDDKFGHLFLPPVR